MLNMIKEYLLFSRLKWRLGIKSMDFIKWVIFMDKMIGYFKVNVVSIFDY